MYTNGYSMLLDFLVFFINMNPVSLNLYDVDLTMHITRHTSKCLLLVFACRKSTLPGMAVYNIPIVPPFIDNFQWINYPSFC